MLIPPPSSAVWLASNVAGLVLGVAFVVWQSRPLGPSPIGDIDRRK